MRQPPAFLSNYHGKRWPRRCRRARVVSSNKLIDFRFDSNANFTVRQAADGLTKWTRIAGIYLVESQIRSADIWVALGEIIEILGQQREQLLLMRGGVGQRVDLQLVKHISEFRLVGQARGSNSGLRWCRGSA